MAGANTARERDIALAGVHLHYATWGARTREDRTVLLVHGLTATHREFADLGPLIAADGWYVVAPDLRGRGLSAKPEHGYGLPFHADDLLSLCDALDLGQVALVGHSLGALIGLYIGALYPKRLSKLVMVDFGARIPEDTREAIAASIGRLGVVFPSLDAYLGLARLAPMFEWSPFWEQYFRYDAEVHPDGTVTARAQRFAIEEEVATLAVLRKEELAQGVCQPTFVARAQYGTLGPDEGVLLSREDMERLHATMRDCRVAEIPDTNHYTIMLSDTFNQMVRAFLAE